MTDNTSLKFLFRIKDTQKGYYNLMETNVSYPKLVHYREKKVGENLCWGKI